MIEKPIIRRKDTVLRYTENGAFDIPNFISSVAMDYFSGNISLASVRRELIDGRELHGWVGDDVLVSFLKENLKGWERFYDYLEEAFYEADSTFDMSALNYDLILGHSGTEVSLTGHGVAKRMVSFMETYDPYQARDYAELFDNEVEMFEGFLKDSPVNALIPLLEIMDSELSTPFHAESSCRAELISLLHDVCVAGNVSKEVFEELLSKHFIFKDAYLSSVAFLDFAEKYSETFYAYRGDYKNSVLVAPTRDDLPIKGDSIYANIHKGKVDITIVDGDVSNYSEDRTISFSEFESSFKVIGIEKASFTDNPDIDFEEVKEAYKLFSAEKENPKLGSIPLDQIKMVYKDLMLEVTLKLSPEYCASRFGFIPHKPLSFEMDFCGNVYMELSAMDKSIYDQKENSFFLTSREQQFLTSYIQYQMDTYNYDFDKTCGEIANADDKDLFPVYFINDFLDELQLKKGTLSIDAIKETFDRLVEEHATTEEMKERCFAFYTKNEDFILTDAGLKDSPRFDSIKSAYETGKLQETSSYEYIKKEVVKKLRDFQEEQLISDPFFLNVTTPERMDSFVQEVIPEIGLKEHVSMPIEAIDKCLQDFDSDILGNCVTEYLMKDTASMFLNGDASVLLDTSKRKDMDFSLLSKGDSTMFSFEKEGNGMIRIDNVFENTDDELAFLLNSLNDVMELTYDMSISMGVKIDRATLDVEANLNVTVDYQSNHSPVVKVPIALTRDEKMDICDMVDLRLEEPLKVSEQDLKKNSTLVTKYKEDKDKKHKDSYSREKTKGSVGKEETQRNDEAR